MYVSTNTLPDSLQRALKSVGYHRNDIEMNIKEDVCVQSSGGDGKRSFFCILNLSNGEYSTEYGSWGGSNAESNRVDNDSKYYTIPDNVVVILGSEGNVPVYARVYIQPNNMLKGILPSQEELDEDMISVLYAYKCLKSGVYRNEAISGKEKVVEHLISKKYLKRDGRGVQITIEGKNAYESSKKSGNYD